MHYQNVLFDLDGTLTDPREGITRSIQFALSKMGIEEPDLTQLEHFIGPPLLQAFMEFYAFTDWVYRSEVNFFLYESTEFTGKSLLEGGLRVGYDWNDGKYDLAVYGRNITNQIRVVGGIDFNNLTGMINEPRLWGLEFKAQF